MPANHALYENHNRSLITISDEHAHLVELLDILDSAIKLKPRAPNIVGAVLDDIFDETSEHFLHEEAIMLEAGFSDFLAHQKDHQTILALMKSLIERHSGGESGIDSEIRQLIEGWMQRHFKSYDGNLVVLLTERF